MKIDEAEMMQQIRAYVASPPGGPPHSEFIALSADDRLGVMLSHHAAGTHQAEHYAAQLWRGEPYGPLLTVRPDNGPDGVSTTRKAFGDDEPVVKLIAGMVRALAQVSA